MKQHISLAVSLVLFAVSACTPSPSENASSTKSASPTATSASTPSDKPKTEEPKAETKPETSAANGWQDYSSAAGKFSIQMPNKPQEQSQEQKTDIATVKMNIVLTESNGAAYFASYADFPEKFPDSAIQERLTEAIKGIVGSMKGEIKSSKESKLGETACRDFEGVGKVQSTDASVKGRVCLADNSRFYQVFTLAPSDKFVSADVDRFIASFKINK